MDLESVKGSWLNGERVEARRFVELLDGDVLRFGEWEGEFVVMLPPVEGGKKKGGGEGLGEG
jgi:smad nuclear-interacting protein 1